MERIDKVSLGTGVLILAIGLILLFYSFIYSFLLIYSIILIGLGIIILVTLKKQEYIEPIKKEKKIKKEITKK